MKTKLFVLFVALSMLFLSYSANAQTCNNHTVTATITDSDGQAWANGSFTVSVYNPSGTQSVICRSTGSGVTTNYSGTLNSSGALSVSLPDTNSVDPAGVQWVFTISPNASVNGTIMTPVTVTANVSYTSRFSAQATAPRFTCTDVCHGYRTAEVTTAIVGSIFFNSTPSASPTCNQWSGSSWLSCGQGTGASSVAVTNTTANQSYYPLFINNFTTGSYSPFVSNQFTYNPALGATFSPSFNSTSNTLPIGGNYQSLGNDIVDASTTGGVGSMAYFSTRDYTVEGASVGVVAQSTYNTFGGNFLANHSYAVSAFGTGTPASAGAPCTNSQRGMRYRDFNQPVRYTCQGSPGFTIWVRDGDNTLSFQGGQGDGTNAITAATYPTILGENTTDSTITFTAFKCWSDNNGTTTVNFTNGAGTSLLTAPITCTTSGATGTQSATITLAAGDIVKASVVADGATKNMFFDAHAVY